MANRATKDDWLDGPGDLREAEVEVRLTPDGAPKAILVRGLAAAFSNDATTSAVEMSQTPKGDQVAKVNTGILERLKFQHGVIDPEFTEDEVEVLAEKYGPAFNTVVEKIDELSGTSPEDVAAIDAKFPGGAAGAGRADVGNGANAGDARSAVPARASA